jgi:hypothetical protein
MRRFLIVSCIWFSFLAVPAITRSMAAGASHSALAAGSTPAGSQVSFALPGKVNTMIPLSDGRMLMGGSFVSIGGQAASHSLAMKGPAIFTTPHTLILSRNTPTLIYNKPTSN